MTQDDDIALKALYNEILAVMATYQNYAQNSSDVLSRTVAASKVAAYQDVLGRIQNKISNGA